MPVGSPGIATPRWKPKSGKRSVPSKLRSAPPKPGAACIQAARAALRTYQPGPSTTSPCGPRTMRASGMAAAAPHELRLDGGDLGQPPHVALLAGEVGRREGGD